MPELTQKQRFQTINQVNWVCTAVDTLLTIVKLLVGFLARSPALIADGLHSLSDLGTDLLALLLGNLAKHGPDANHPYGHARYETMGTAVLGAVLLLVAILIGIDNLLALLHNKTTQPHWLALAVAGLSVISKEALFHYTMHFANKTRSKLLEANAWHSRSDSLSSIAVLVGVLFSLLGYAFVEYLAAITVALLIGKMGFSLGWNAIQDLIDRGVSTDQQQKYEQTLSDIKDILNVHRLRTRLMGNDVMIDAHILVAPRLSISEAHQINDFAISRLKTLHKEITDVTLHIDFENDADGVKKTLLLPMRQSLQTLLDSAGLKNYSHFHLHYQNNQVVVELIFNDAEVPAEYKEKCLELVKDTVWIHSISILVSH